MKKSILFLALVALFISCEKNPNLKDYGDYNVIENYYDDITEYQDHIDVWTLTFDETYVYDYFNDSLREKQPYTREKNKYGDDCIIKFNSSINGSVTIDIIASDRQALSYKGFCNGEEVHGHFKKRQ